MTRILLVDDEPDILESTNQLLQAYGFEVATCDDAHRVMDVMHNTPPDMVLHDVRMPNLDLTAQLRALRADAQLRHIPIILFTATLSAKGLAAAVGADDGIEKPFEPDKLVALIKKWTQKSPVA